MFMSTPLMSKYGYEANILLARMSSNGQWFVNSYRVFYRVSGSSVMSQMAEFEVKAVLYVCVACSLFYK